MSVLKIFVGLLVLLLFFAVDTASANIPFRVSVKFIVDANGHFPQTGDFSSIADVNEQEETGNLILMNMLSEMRMEVIEIIDLPKSLSEYHTLEVSEGNIAAIRSLAMASPTTWSWRTNAVNVYVTAGAGSAIAYYPPKNDTVLMGQGIFNTTLVHELGHSLHLKHTHDSDSCSDTLPDNKDWNSKDDMANNSFGKNYALLTATQQAQVDMTWTNIMSYHQPRSVLSPCQKDRVSMTASIDASWLLTKTPFYVHPVNSYNICYFSQTCNGTFAFPFASLQQVLLYEQQWGGISGRSIVLEQGTYSMGGYTDINFNVDIFTRQGASRVDNEALRYTLPTSVSDSGSAAGIAAKAAQRESTLGRKVLRDGEKEAAAASEKSRAEIKAKAKEKHRQHNLNALKHYETAEKHASGRERHAIQMELGQRHRQSGNYAKCYMYFKRVADDSEQIHLKEKALRNANECKKKMVAKSTKVDVIGGE